MRLNRLLTSTGAALLLASGLATQANAGAINMDFLLDANTVITGADVVDSSTTSDHKTSGPNDLTAGFAVDLGASGFSAFAGKSLNITGTRSAVVSENTGTWLNPVYTNQDMRLSRWEGNGLGVCSNTASNSTFTGCDEEHVVDGFGVNESIKFSISPTLSFAVRYVTFNFTDPTDDVEMRFKAGLGTEIDFELRYDDDNYYRNCDGGTCTVDIYALAEAAAKSANPGPDPDYTPFNNVGLTNGRITTYTPDSWDVGGDYIFDFLASGAGFEFAVSDETDFNDGWKIAGAVWVAEDVPEPASMTLLGAGIMGLGYLNRRRKAA